MSLESLLSKYEALVVPAVPAPLGSDGTAEGRSTASCSSSSICSSTETQIQNRLTDNTEPPQVSTSHIATCHANPLWIKARDAWHKHYYSCKDCQRYHRSLKHRPDENPCLQGKVLHQQYEEHSSN